MKCPACNNSMSRIGVGEEYIELTTDGKAIKKLPQKWACVNPYCVNYAGDSNNPNRAVPFQYEKSGKIITEHDMRPKIDFGTPSHIEIDEHETELPIKTDIKAFAEQVVLKFTGNKAMILASKLADKATQEVPND